MMQNLGVKHVSYAAFFWWDLKTTNADVETKLAAAKQIADDLHAMDPDIIVGAACFETIGPSANDVSIPVWVFNEMGLPVENRNFRWDLMLYTDQRVSDRIPTSPAIDITKLESRMWYYDWSRRYIDLGFEHMDFGELFTVTESDRPVFESYRDVVNRVRQYGRMHARRGLVLISAQTYPANKIGEWDNLDGSHGLADTNGNLVLDYYYHATRAKENPGSPQDCILSKYQDTIYGRSLGGISPSGWL